MLARFNGVSTGSPATLATVLGYSSGDFDVAAGRRVFRLRAARARTTDRHRRRRLAAAARNGNRSAGRRALVRDDVATVSDFCKRRLSRTRRSRLGCRCARDREPQHALPCGYIVVAAGPPRATGSHGRRHADPRPRFRRLRNSATKRGHAVLKASHDGYLKRFGLIHSRHLSLSPTGDKLEGIDTLEPPKGKLRLKQDLPYAIHFHLHPDCRCTLDGRTVCRIVLPDGQFWIFSAKDAPLSLEESLYFVDSAGPRPGCRSCFAERRSAKPRCAGHARRGVRHPRDESSSAANAAQSRVLIAGMALPEDHDNRLFKHAG